MERRIRACSGRWRLARTHPGSAFCRFHPWKSRLCEPFPLLRRAAWARAIWLQPDFGVAGTYSFTLRGVDAS
jgi:hypothetical protein